ncbi:P-loop containing nucleoside triphosphate hydrolase protein [Lipomyces oligophaga]|uniref:P-loop containing nucleoside triphosphate hydrolase protein n=1 Tax=Lipomyces oligophaga TaxID=45792 RepID=UPI0034CD1E1F
MREGIKKKAAATRKKNKKLAKKDPTWKSRVKNTGRLEIDQIPNSFPYKNKLIEEILKENEAEKIAREKKRLANREKAKELAAENGLAEEITLEDDGDLVEDEEMQEGSEMNALLAYARRAAKNMNDEEGDSGNSDGDADEDHTDGEEMDIDREVVEKSSSVKIPSGWAKESSRKAFDKMFKSVVDASDVILYVLDARDPEGTRSLEVEKAILGSMDKRLVFVLNKIDLIPSNVQKSWETYLKNYFPVISVRASNAAPNAQVLNNKNITPQSTASTLLQALKSYANRANLKRSISVGIIGYPNVGKSSIINALTSKLGGRKNVCPVGAEAGVTTSLREVKIDSKLKLIDSPGIVFPSSQESITTADMDAEVAAEARLLLLGALPPKQITDAAPAVTMILQRLEPISQLWDDLMKYYNLPSLMPKMSESGVFDKSTDFLVQVARKRGRIGKFGIPNIQAAAVSVLNDWRDGRIQRWVLPPTTVANSHDTGVTVLKSKAGKNVEQKEIVKTWAEEFNLEGLWSSQDQNDDSEIQ